MTVFSSGISMYAMARLIQALHLFDAPFAALGLSPTWVFHVSILISAVIVLVYIFLGGLTSAIYNEVLQFFLIVAGFVPLVCLGLRSVGGWRACRRRLPPPYLHAWAGALDQPETQPDGRRVVRPRHGAGLRAVVRLLVHRLPGRAAGDGGRSMTAARRTPLIAAVPKMLFPFLVILPGMIAMALTPQADIAAKLDPPTGAAMHGLDGTPATRLRPGDPDRCCCTTSRGMLGLGLTALLASFMSGMAGNVTAFNTVWTYDIYQSYIKPDASDAHYLWIGRMTTVVGIALSVATAYLATRFNNIMDMLQLVFAFVNAPLFATFLLGMFWKRATGHGAFCGPASPARWPRRCTTA